MALRTSPWSPIHSPHRWQRSSYVCALPAMPSSFPGAIIPVIILKASALISKAVLAFMLPPVPYNTAFVRTALTRRRTTLRYASSARLCIVARLRGSPTLGNGNYSKACIFRSSQSASCLAAFSRSVCTVALNQSSCGSPFRHNNRFERDAPFSRAPQAGR